MATITRIEAIEQIQEVLKAYENKIRDIRFDTEKLSPEGKNIVDSYCSNEKNEQVLVKKAYSKKKFFKKVNETQLLEFYKVCYELNKNLSLDVKELLLITAIEEDKESFWESFWGALQGEFNEDPSGASILIDMGLNFIPFVGQVLDARDILACLDKLIRQKRTHEIMIWVTLVLTAIGCVPYAGDVIKAIGKAIVKGADDIIITLLKKLDAEDVYKAFIKFYNKLNESLEEAIKIINQWLLEAEKRYNETDLSELIRNANEYINKAIEFIQTKIDEFAQKMFGKGNITLDVKLLEETSSNSKKTIKFVNGQITGEITNALKTEPGTAFFWSGCAKVDPSSGKLLVSGDEVAAEIANKCGGTTLETQIKVNNIEMPKWDFDVPESIKAWEDTSAAYVKQVSGDVRAIVGKKLRPENIWENVELPRLMQNPNVSKITTIDPDTMAETVIFERKAGTVYIRPNETLIKNGKWDEILESMKNDKSIGEIIDINSNKQIIIETSGIKGNWNKVLNNELEPNKIYKVGDYSYFTDEAGRVNKVSGELKLETKDRNIYQQGKSVEIKDGVRGKDQGGHIIARIFNGPGEQINYVPQTATLNNGEWKTMEKKWNDALSEGKKVEVDIKINYADNLRPTDFDVTYIIKTSDGKIEKTENLFFLN